MTQVFSPDHRGAGLLLHVTSLPSPYGIGDLGPGASAWIDLLCDAGQGWWQALPLGPTGYANSPYQPMSSFAGNWLLISPDALIEEGLLQASDCEGPAFPENFVDYDAVVTFKRSLLERAWRNFSRGNRPDLRPAYEQFCHSQSHWLDDYALFRALKVRHNGADYIEWPTELVRRDPDAMAQAGRELETEIGEVRLTQFLLFRQGERLKDYAHAKGLRLIGDLPFFAAPDSSDVWANPELFLLDERRRPRFVAGVPPDYFSAQGQLWGNPVYDWDVLKRTGYRWCLDRIRALLAHVDVIRLDHFRGFAAAWYVPAGSPTAQSGKWVSGPGADFFEAVEREFGGLPFIAEDLGMITADVSELRDRYHLPGMRVLQFGFDGDPNNPHLPHNYVQNSVAYTGTHDNNTTRGWFEALPEGQKQLVRNYLGRSSGTSDGIGPAFIRLSSASASALSIAPLQDVLDLAAEARMNVPGTAEGNWRWRCTESMLSASNFCWLRKLTRACCRWSDSPGDVRVDHRDPCDEYTPIHVS
ncbi:MAG TPA: 4-alpha-glucanotransferase [Bryobacteraceae bacterium]|nr:4-alpha-glucanotransferase [Bryobacteraceae bacterium]